MKLPGEGRQGRRIEFKVEGEAKAQPRVKARIVETKTKDFVHIYTPNTANDWKKLVKDAALAAIGGTPLDGAVTVQLTFVFGRPKAHYGTGRNSDKLKSWAPSLHVQKPDVDNLAKAVLDALVDCKAMGDDARVISLNISKFWANDTGVARPGVLVQVTEIILPEWATRQSSPAMA